MILKRQIVFLLSIFFMSLNSYGQNDMKKAANDNVIVQMNYCINSLTNIIYNKSMPVLEHESDQLVNNLTMEQIIGLDEIKDFRVNLMDAVSRFEITEEERNVMRRIQSIKRNNMKWAAMSNALNPTMLLTGNGSGFGPQMAFQTLLTAARSVVEYKTMQGEQNIEELQAMWDLRKEDMQTINDLRKSAQSIVFDLYNKYHLSENDRLTEATSNQFNDYIAEADAAKRVRILEDNYATYNKFPDYYYHLGMAYVDVKNYQKAKQSFLVYLNLYRHTPILRYDEKSGCIALTMLTYEKNLSPNEKEELINTAIKNLPSNSAAILQCAMVYIYELKNYEKGFQLIRSGLDDPKASDRDLLFMAAANLMPCLDRNSKTYKSICEAFANASQVSIDSYLTYLIFSQSNAWQTINSVLPISNYSHRLWYTLWICRGFSKSFELTIPANFSYSTNDFFVYIEKHSEDKLIINQLTPKYLNSITEDDINDVDCFKANKDLKYLFVESITQGIYKLKENIDVEKIKDESFPRLSEFVLSEDDINDIVEFCEDYKNEEKNLILKYDNIEDASEIEVSTDETYENTESSVFKKLLSALKSESLDKIDFYGDTLTYIPHHTKKQEGYYIRFVLNNGVQIMYKYNDDNNVLEPYVYISSENIVYANPLAKQEYTYKESNIDQKKEASAKSSDDESSWYDSILSIFSSENEEKNDSTNVQKQNKDAKQDEESFWSKLWSSINVFSSDEKD